MTDNDIVKALENYRDSRLWEVSDEWKKLSKEALDLINRLQAENERLRNVKSHIDILIHRGVEYPTSETYNEAFQKALEKLYDNDNAKAEAYKECLDKIEQRDVSESDFYIMVKKTEFDNLLKEMEGENNE